MTYRDTLLGLAEDTERRVLAVFASYLDGDVDRDTAVRLIATIIAKANSGAASLADLSLAATLMLQQAEPVATVGILAAADDVDRLQKAATTLLAIDNVTTQRVARLARCEPLDAAAKAMNQGIQDQPTVVGWVRGLEPDACQLCRWWWREGQVWPADHPMPHHTGCTCVQVPTPMEEK